MLKFTRRERIRNYIVTFTRRQSEKHQKRMTHTHTMSHTHQQQSRRQRLADRWSLSNRQETKNMVAVLHSLRKHAHTHSVVLQQGLSTFKKPTFLNQSQYSCVPVASAALLSCPLILKRETVTEA